MSRTRRFLGGIGSAYANQVAVTVIGLWLTPFLLRRLGPHDYGLWLTATQVIMYLTLLDLGVLALLPRETAYAVGRSSGAHDTPDLRDVVGRTAGLMVWQMPIIAIVAVGVLWCLPASWSDLQFPLALVLAGFVLTYPLRIFQAMLQGLQDLAFVGGLQLAAWLLGVALTIQFVRTGWGITALAAGALLTQLTLLGGCAVRVGMRYTGALPRRLPATRWRETTPHIQKALWVSLSQLAQVLLYGTDLLLVAWLFGPAAVVPYACTQKLISVLANQPQVLTQAAAPALSELRMGASREKLFSVTSALSLALMLASGAVVTVVLAVNHAFVSWWVGPGQYGGLVLTAVFLTAMLVRHWNTALVYSLFSFGHERRLSLTTLADGAVTLILSLVLARVVGAIGVPLGFLGGALVVSIPANLTALARHTGVSCATFTSTLRPWALRLMILVPLAAAANLLVTPTGVVPVISLLLLAASAYTAMMAPVALQPPLGEYVRQTMAPLLERFDRGTRAPQPALLPRDPGPLV